MTWTVTNRDRLTDKPSRRWIWHILPLKQVVTCWQTEPITGKADSYPLIGRDLSQTEAHSRTASTNHSRASAGLVAVACMQIAISKDRARDTSWMHKTFKKKEGKSRVYLHDSLQHFLWIGVKEPVNIVATSCCDLLHGNIIIQNKSIWSTVLPFFILNLPPTHTNKSWYTQTFSLLHKLTGSDPPYQK